MGEGVYQKTLFLLAVSSLLVTSFIINLQGFAAPDPKCLCP